MSEKCIVEINGVKMEIDLRDAKIVDHYKIGDNVKVLIKSYGDSYSTYPGVIVAFDEFEQLPTITVCYVEISYTVAEIKFKSLNSKTTDIEIVRMANHEQILDRQRAIDLLDKGIAKAQNEVDEQTRKRNYFVEKYSYHFDKEPK